MAMRKSDPPPSTNLTRKDIEGLIEIIHEKGIEEFELEQGGMRLRIVSNRPMASSPVFHHAPQSHAVPAPVSAPPPSAPAAQGEVAATSSTPHESPENDPKLKKVTSPMVGTFYRAPSPGSKPFCEVGDKVDEDTVLCIIEAMKLMNEIKAEMRGTVKKILVDNAQPVEYGQAIYLIDPA